MKRQRVPNWPRTFRPPIQLGGLFFFCFQPAAASLNESPPKWIFMIPSSPYLSALLLWKLILFLKNAWNAGGSYFFQKDFFKNKIQLYSSIISLNINRILIVLETKCFWFDPSAYPLNQCQIRGSCFLIGCQGPFLKKILKNSKSTSFDGEFDADYENLIFRIF